MPRDVPDAHAQPDMTVGNADLDRVIASLLTDMRTAPAERATELARRLADLLDRREAAAEQRIAEIDNLASHIDRAVHALDDAASTAELMRRACEQVAELCRARTVLISRLDEKRIIPMMSFSTDPDASPSLPRECDLLPGSTEARALETNTVSVDDMVPDQMRELLGSNGYCAIPVVVDGHAAALMHVDTTLDGPRRHALSVFAEMLGGCFERTGLETRREHQERLLRDSARRWTSDVDIDALPPRDAVDSAHMPRGHAEVDERLLDPLTEREADVVRLILTGASNAAIATELVITVDTVKSHVKRILRKLGVSNRAELIAKYQSLLG